jgi:hypothetical protein
MRAFRTAALMRPLADPLKKACDRHRSPTRQNQALDALLYSRLSPRF